MATNIFQKDLKANALALQSVSLNCLAHCVNTNISPDIFQQTFQLIHHSKS